MQLESARSILKVSELNAEVALLMQSAFPLLWVEGEISNLSRPSSGHLYFALKDSKAQVRCAMFKNKNMHLKIKPENGLKVLARVRVSLYEPRGEYQLVVEHLEDAGEGQLQREFEALKKKLMLAGLFDKEHKKELPAFPQRIGVITSPTGAAIHDIINVLERRCPSIPVLIYGVPVQGQQAAPEIVKALHQANFDKRCDVLILARGGGSIEDLWAFNEEIVAQAVFASEIPIVCGVGHEIDFTIADLVADQRAPTPSAAAELISPETASTLRKVNDLSAKLHKLSEQLIRQKTTELHMLTHRLGQLSGEQSIQQNKQRIDELELRLQRGLHQYITQRTVLLRQLKQRVMAQSPIKNLNQRNAYVTFLEKRLHASTQKQLQHYQSSFHHLSRQLHAVSPLATLQRGYAIAQKDNHVVHSVTELTKDDQINVMFIDGDIDCQIHRINQTDPARKP